MTDVPNEKVKKWRNAYFFMLSFCYFKYVPFQIFGNMRLKDTIYFHTLTVEHSVRIYKVLVKNKKRNYSIFLCDINF